MTQRRGVNLRPQVTTIETVAKSLYSLGVVNLDSLTLAHGGNEIPAYMEFDHLWANPVARNHALSLFISLLKSNVPDTPEYKLVPVPCGANGFTFGAALRWQLPLAFVEKADKVYGTPSRIRGAAKGDRVVLCDDVINLGDSVVEVADACEDAGLIVTDVLAFVDREQGGYARLKYRGYRVHTVFTLSRVLDFGVKFGKITPEDRHKFAEDLAALPRYFIMKPSSAAG